MAWSGVVAAVSRGCCHHRATSPILLCVPSPVAGWSNQTFFGFGRCVCASCCEGFWFWSMVTLGFWANIDVLLSLSDKNYLVLIALLTHKLRL